MVQAKCVFKNCGEEHQVAIQHYHADNGHLVDNLFITECQAKGQGITYCRVNAHHQNGVAKKRIWDLKGESPCLVTIHLE